MAINDFITKLFSEVIQSGDARRLEAFFTLFLPGLTPAAAVALLEAETTASDLSAFEEAAEEAWQAAEQAEAQRAALALALDALDHLLYGQPWQYNGYEYQHAICALYELSLGNPAIQQARRALGILAGNDTRKPARRKMEAARLEVVKLLEASQ